MSRSNSPKRRRQDPERRPPVAAVRSCITHKRGYPTRAQAKRAMKITNKYRRGSGVARIERTAYLCPQCGKWHTSSQLPRQRTQ